MNTHWLTYFDEFCSLCGCSLMNWVFLTVWVYCIDRIVDSLEESCHCNDSAVCITSVDCVEDMLGTLEQICLGEGLTPELSRNMTRFYRTVSETGTCKNIKHEQKFREQIRKKLQLDYIQKHVKIISMTYCTLSVQSQKQKKTPLIGLSHMHVKSCCRTIFKLLVIVTISISLFFVLSL